MTAVAAGERDLDVLKRAALVSRLAAEYWSRRAPLLGFTPWPSRSHCASLLQGQATWTRFRGLSPLDPGARVLAGIAMSRRSCRPMIATLLYQ